MDDKFELYMAEMEEIAAESSVTVEEIMTDYTYEMWLADNENQPVTVTVEATMNTMNADELARTLKVPPFYRDWCERFIDTIIDVDGNMIEVRVDRVWQAGRQKSKVYVFSDEEISRKAIRTWRQLVKDVFDLIGIAHSEDIRWDSKCGCHCGCSPGFQVKGTEYPYNVYITLH